jgi:hypothetical protein
LIAPMRSQDLLVAANLGLSFNEIPLEENLPPFLERYAVVPARGGSASTAEKA